MTKNIENAENRQNRSKMTKNCKNRRFLTEIRYYLIFTRNRPDLVVLKGVIEKIGVLYILPKKIYNGANMGV